MSDWQPARIRVSHIDEQTRREHTEVIRRIESLVIRVRKGSKPPKKMQRPCDSDIWFEVHPEDVRKINPESWLGGMLCEHEILTD